MGITAEGGAKTKNTVLFALLLLFFVQLLGMWIESIYRMSLIKLAPGKELYGVLLLLLPLAVFAFSERRERVFLWIAVVTFVAMRLLCPMLGAVGQILAGGVGVSMFLVILAYAFSERHALLKGDMGQAVGIAVLLSLVFRSWGSSADISMSGTTPGLCLTSLLACLALCLFWSSTAGTTIAQPSPTLSACRLFPAMLGLFANLTLVYLLYSCPAVVPAWIGYAQLGFSGLWASGCVAVAFAVALLLSRRMASPGMPAAGAWNVILIALLAGGLYLGRPVLPVSAASPAVFANGIAAPGSSLLYLALLLSPVVMFNVRHIAGLSPCARPRNAVLPVMAGMVLLFTLALLLIFSNVWGYVPFGTFFRNRFYLPFLVAGVVTLLPWLLPRQSGEYSRAPGGGRLLGALAILLPMLALAGAFVHMPLGNPVKPKRDLTILTYNMQQGSHINGDRNYIKQLDLLRRLNPDIIGLQESDTARPSGGNVDAVRFLAESLGYYAYYGPGSVTGTFGAAILSRYPIKSARSFFSHSDSDEVGTAVAEIDVDGTTIAFFSTHPSGGSEVMEAFVAALKAEAGKYAHVIAVGDYNFTPREPYFASLSELLQDSAAQLGGAKVDSHGGNPNLADEIDHIFVSRNFGVVESHYLPPTESETDHPAHWSVVKMGN
jgi:endonuclease/exonuclease/phosphatase family metal-dependent hydrolase